MIDINLLLGIAAFSVLVGGFLRGFSGFGAGLAIVPMLSLLYRPADAVVIFALLEVIAALQLIPAVARQAQWRSVVAISLSAAVTVPLGAWLLITVDADIMRRSIAVFVLAFSAVLASGWRFRGVPSQAVELAIGSLSGVLAGAATLGGPPVILFYLSGIQRAGVVRASLTVYFVFVTLWALLMFAWLDIVTVELILRAVFLAPGYVLGMGLGSRLFRFASEQAFRRSALVLLVVIALVVLLG